MRYQPVRSAFILTLAAIGLSAQATENQQLRALLGAPGQEMTLPQLPGLYGQVWAQHYEATKFRNGDGDDQVTDLGNGVSAVRGGKISANVLVPRLTWVSEAHLGDGRLGVSVTLPIIDLDVHTTATGRFPAGFPSSMASAIQAQLNGVAAANSGSQTGLGDTEIAPFVDFQDDESRLVLLAALVAPTGDYKSSRAINPGAGKFWTIRPGFLYGRAWENGLEFGTRVTYSINTENTATDYKSGQYVHADYSLMYRVNDSWRAGLQGYFLKQFTKDKGEGVAADGNKAQVLAAGPAVGYSSEDGRWGAEVKVLPEFLVRNKSEGTTSWLRLMFRVD
ncbi:transporter [Ideonella azotifigens]|uniref:Transporter n=1 Tax=Ideonella azotifigens TaxID=513160 RepID=A0ABN1JLF8_9BURK|nr:transporter [Ideonella azotifigens]MCD2339716.1 transporter [Ideonella azotifigens]